MKFSRRSVLKSSLLLPAVFQNFSGTFAQKNFQDDFDNCGVASGAPTPDGFVLWTRIPSTAQQESGICDVICQLSLSLDFSPSSVIKSIVSKVSSETDFTLRVKVSELEEDSTYYYRFICDSYISEVGRARTLPHSGGKIDSFTFGVVSCQKFSDGFYTALAAIRAEDVHFVIHLGDHIYEQETGKVRIDCDPLKGAPAETLSDYRIKYRHYLSDPDYREARRYFTWIDLLDDHEVFNDYAGQRDRSLKKARVAAAYQAYVEYMPIDHGLEFDQNGLPTLSTIESIKIGNLIEMFRMDQRQFRTPNPCSRAFVTKRCEAAEAETHTMLGVEQFAWLKESLGSSSAKWKVLLSEVMFTLLKVNSIFMADANTTSELEKLSKTNDIAEKYLASKTTYLNLDAWDGYPAEREKLVDFIAGNKIDNVIALTGDIHASVHGKVLRTGQSPDSTPIFYEIVTTSLTSSTLGEKLGPLFGPMAGGLIARSNPHVEWSNIYAHGYSIVTATNEEFKIRQMAVSTITTNQADLKVSKLFSLKDRFNRG